MRTQSLKPYHANYHSLVSRETPERVDAPTDSGLISELVYSENQPAVTQLLLPLLLHHHILIHKFELVFYSVVAHKGMTYHEFPQLTCEVFLELELLSLLKHPH